MGTGTGKCRRNQTERPRKNSWSLSCLRWDVTGVWFARFGNGRTEKEVIAGIRGCRYGSEGVSKSIVPWGTRWLGLVEAKEVKKNLRRSHEVGQRVRSGKDSCTEWKGVNFILTGLGSHCRILTRNLTWSDWWFRNSSSNVYLEKENKKEGKRIGFILRPVTVIQVRSDEGLSWGWCYLDVGVGGRKRRKSLEYLPSSWLK